MNVSRALFLRALALTAVGFTPSGLLTADVIVATAPYGVIAEPVGRGTRGLAFPLVDGNRYVGLIADTAGATIGLTDASSDPRAAIADAGPAYVEILSGPWEGERFDVDLAATAAADGAAIVVALGAGTHSTRGVLPPGLDGAKLAVRPHVTLARLQAMLTPALSGSNSSGRADAVEVFSGKKFVRYHLRGDNATWRRSGSSADQRHFVIPPDVSVLIDTRSGGRTWVHAGVVRTNAFRKNLVEGEQAFASGFPVDLSPIQAGAFVDSDAPAGTRWRGSFLFPFADWFEEQGVLIPLLHRYFLQANGTSWRRVLDLRDVADEPILEATSMFILRRNNPDPDYLIPVPFAL